MKKICLLAALLVAASGAQAGIIDSSFVNLDFDASTSASGPAFKGFDGLNGSAYDVPGWQDLTITDAGTEYEGAWWGPYQQYSAFMQVGDGAYNLGTYTIQTGDEFAISFVGKSWDGASEWTATLFYDDPVNVIGTYVTAVDGTWTTYTDGTGITATPESVGGSLGISFVNTGAGFANLDEVSVNVIPEPATLGLIGFAGAGMLFVRRRLMM